jgi:hypothetical protein
VVQNQVYCWGFVNQATGPTTTSTLTYIVNTADNTANSYDLGIYDSSGNRIAHTGALPGTTLFSGTTVFNPTWTSSANLTPGMKYYFAATSSAATPLAKFSGSITLNFQNSNNCGSSSSAVLPSTITVPADSWVTTSATPTVVFR